MPRAHLRFHPSIQSVVENLPTQAYTNSPPPAHPMTLPTDTPKLPKWPFLIGDAALLGLMWIIADQGNRNPFTRHAALTIVTCVALAALCGVVPFLSSYACPGQRRSTTGSAASTRCPAPSPPRRSKSASRPAASLKLPSSRSAVRPRRRASAKIAGENRDVQSPVEIAGADDREELEEVAAPPRRRERRATGVRGGQDGKASPSSPNRSQRANISQPVRR